mmetsp:Transcript_722/g.2755  ORF Transcript_722/g.2755 Transcript_722/m.2755 type:complete len:218 (+) Transcript_722:181-834(+)
MRFRSSGPHRRFPGWCTRSGISTWGGRWGVSPGGSWRIWRGARSRRLTSRRFRRGGSTQSRGGGPSPPPRSSSLRREKDGQPLARVDDDVITYVRTFHAIFAHSLHTSNVSGVLSLGLVQRLCLVCGANRGEVLIRESHLPRSNVLAVRRGADRCGDAQVVRQLERQPQVLLLEVDLEVGLVVVLAHELALRLAQRVRHRGLAKHLEDRRLVEPRRL